MNVASVWAGPNDLGEGPFWHVKEQALYWVDIFNPHLHRLDPKTNEHQSWVMPDVIGCAVACESGGFIAGIQDEICHIDLPSGKITVKQKTTDGLRLNDGKCDRNGRFWVGSVDQEKFEPRGHLYCYHPDGTFETKAEGIVISNGLAWSLDNTQFYYTDSLAHAIWVYDYDHDTGAISNRRVFFESPGSEHLPDGLTIDADGYIWSARYAGKKLIRHAPDGSIDRELALPVDRPTSCAFGGPNFETLYITSCCKEPDQSALPAPAGSLLAVNVGVCGVPESMFAL